MRNRRKLYALAAELGVAPSSVSRWLQGGPISLRHVIALGRELDLSLDWLLLGRGSPDCHRTASPPVVFGLERALRSAPPQTIQVLKEIARYAETLHNDR